MAWRLLATGPPRRARGAPVAHPGPGRHRGASGGEDPQVVSVGSPKGPRHAHRRWVPRSSSSVERALRRRGLLLPTRYLAHTRENARRRRRCFLDPPTRRNRVWQMDFTQFETTSAGTWYVSGVVDYATKVCLAAPVSGTQTARDVVQALREAIGEAERLLGHSLLEDCIDPGTGELTPVIVVSDNGPAYKSSSFLRFIMSRPEFDHVRTRHHAPETNGGGRAVLPRSQVRPSLPLGDSQRLRSGGGSSALPRRVQPDPSSRVARAGPSDLSLHRRIQPIQSRKCP